MRKYRDPQKEQIKKTLIKRYVKTKKDTYLLYLDNKKKTLPVVTYEALIQNGKITKEGWGFLRELALHIRLRFYPRYKEKEDLTLDLMLKGATQILEYKGAFPIINWRNYIFSGMRNTASNANYFLNKDRLKIIDVTDEEFIKYYEKYLKKTRYEDEETEESSINSFYTKLNKAIKKIFNDKYKDVGCLYGYIEKKEDIEEEDKEYNELDTNLQKEVEKLKKRLDVFVKWSE